MHWLRPAALFAMLGMLPDIDFLFGTHSTYTHSIGATVLAGLVAWLGARAMSAGAAQHLPGEASRRPSRGLFALACALAYGSHIVLDGLGDDTTPPIGIMALWPITSDFYQTNLRWFMAISRRYWLPGFWRHNLIAVGRELVILGPIVLLVFWLRARRPTASRHA